MRPDVTNESLMAVRSALSVYRGLSNMEKALEFLANFESYVSELESRKSALENEIERKQSEAEALRSALEGLRDTAENARRSHEAMLSELNASYHKRVSEMESEFLAKRQALEDELSKFEAEVANRKALALQEIDTIEAKRREAEEKLETIRKMLGASS